MSTAAGRSICQIHQCNELQENGNHGQKMFSLRISYLERVLPLPAGFPAMPDRLAIIAQWVGDSTIQVISMK